MSLYEGAVKKPIMTSLCFLAVAIFGLFSLSKLPVDLYPDIETNTIMVMTTYQGASASDIENNVTRPLENVLNSVSNLKHITSRSSENISVITLEFEYGYDIDVLTNDVRDKLDMVSSMLPDEVETPIIFKFSTDMIPILLLSVQAEESQPALYKILDDNVANPLARVPGVGTVSISGAPKREVNVYCDPNKLDAYNLSVETISSIISAENRNTPGGTFDVGSNTYSLRVEGEFKDPKEMENIVVGTHNGASVYLRDVAKVVDSVEERAQKTYSNGVQGAMIVVQKQSGANSVAISQKVIDMLPQLQKSLPSDVKLGIIVNTSDNILNTIDSLEETIMYAMLFVILVVFVFLGRWRATVIICITIPMSLNTMLHYRQMDDLVRMLREKLPNVPMLMTTPPGSYESFRQRRRRRTYKINPRTAVAVQTIRRYADENGLAVWDMYEILGGTHRACLNWQEAGLMRPDHVHYLPDGYRLQGELFYQALLKAYNDYVEY